MKRSLALLLFLIPFISFAYGQLYFGYAPDPWKSERLVLSTVDTPYQLFTLNEDITLTGLEFWVDNTGNSGFITLTLANSEGTTLAVVSTNIGGLGAIPGGHKLHLDVPQEIQLLKDEVYSVQISSSLLGLGLYYTDRINVLTHNENYNAQFASGLARLGNEEQDFTFKFSLFREPPIGEEPDVDPNQTQSSTSTISISNARVVSVTDTTAFFAWTSSIAADSRISIRTQLNPLYVVKSGFDPTLELEHAILVTGLTPDVTYFADIFSNQGENITLSAATIGFSTLELQSETEQEQEENNSEEESQENDTEENLNDPPAEETNGNTESNNSNETSSEENNNSESSSPNQNNNSSENISELESGSDPSLPSLEVGSAPGSGNTTINWQPPEGGEPSSGYRVDVFDHNLNLERKISVPAGTHEVDIPKLSSGKHQVVVYADEGGVYTKTANSISFILTNSNLAVALKIIGITILWIGSITGYLVWKFKKEKTILPAEEGYDPKSFT